MLTIVNFMEEKAANFTDRISADILHDRIYLSRIMDKHGTKFCHVLSHFSKFLEPFFVEQHPVLVENS